MVREKEVLGKKKYFEDKIFLCIFYIFFMFKIDMKLLRIFKDVQLNEIKL